MARLAWAAALLASSPARLVAAHSHISYIIVNGLVYPGFDPKIPDNADNVVGWSTTVADDGFVPPSNYTTPDIVCHRDGAPAKAHAPVRAGDKIHIQWNGWPQSHNGPVMSYLASCGGAADGCASVDKTQLAFFKIDDSSPALLGQPDGPPGTWSTEVLISHNNSWLVGLPPALEPGAYVLRHELLALHYAAQPDGAQNYPQCINLWVMPPDANGTADATGAVVVGEDSGGVRAQELYGAHDPGVDIDIYKNLTTYQIPGPTVISGAAPVVPSSQSLSLSSAAGTPVSVVAAATAVAFPAGTGVVAGVAGRRWA
ncbi:endoglucanase-4 [Phialemonium atrogriseum]|uniref:lytic cellulose monooxygenase (C4-dehydrogenating) n=1 Tax=Phialemonium atrogriseum TaxID=1093897 RepID=A0AAJ0BW75_9PEZI|nr:endoglucanase-4 [Phialemonium atrogriseum]KAK1765593.1 endoglucanase-4 [Phialemonium atrogriseum]